MYLNYNNGITYNMQEGTVSKYYKTRTILFISSTAFRLDKMITTAINCW